MSGAVGGLRSVRVDAASRGYDVVIGSGALAGAAALIRPGIGGARAAHIFVDDGLPAEVAEDLSRRIDATGLRVTRSNVRATEEAKTVQTLYHMVQELARRGIERSDVVVALGGGITGDLAGFAAASYRRGVAWVNCPTTLLSMVDASVGGKTGVNLRSGNDLLKNMVGAFWQPRLVVADVGVLETLTDRDYRAGLAECIKHGMLSAAFGDAELGAWTKDRIGLILERDAGTVMELVARNVAVKARVVAKDEREEDEIGIENADSTGSVVVPGDEHRRARLSHNADTTRSVVVPGGRALLNLGHTFGHAIETLPMVSPGPDASLAPLRHGEAVALGLVCATRCAEIVKMAGEGLADATRAVLRNAGLPVVAHRLPGTGEIIERMRQDKKSEGGVMRLVLPRGDGTCEVVAGVSEETVEGAIEAIRG